MLAVYFAGLALGAALGGRLGHALGGFRAYGVLELGVAVAVVGYVVLRPALAPAATWIARTSPAPLLTCARVAFALAVLLVPTVLLGATLPAATAAIAADEAREAGRLYAWNTAGGALGALAAGFVLVRALGVRGSFLAGVALDVLVAAGALVCAAPAPAATPSPREPSAKRAVLALAALTGFVGLAGEVLWTRGLAGVLSNSVYSFSLVLAAVLAGIVVGARIAVLRPPADGAAARRLGRALAALALTTIASRLALRALPATSIALARALGERGLASGVAIEAALALLVVLAPALALGAAFPLLVAAGGITRPGRALGRTLAANTAGGIAGALIAAFVLLPRLGLGGGLLAIAGLTAGGAAFVLDGRTRWVPAAVVAAAAVAGPVVRVPWRDPGGERVIFERDGPAATVTVTADTRGGKRLRVNGQYSLGGSDGLLLEQREAHLPLLLHPGPRRFLALGVGTGDTVGAATAHPGLAVEAVELLPEVLDATTLFARENRGLPARLVVDDARSFLLATSEFWDVILSDLFLPWTAGTASLYALDFYRLAATRLGAGGLYCQWLPLHQLGVDDLATVVSTFVAAFPEVQLWVAYHRAATPLAALVGSATPIRLDVDRLRARMRDPALAPALAAVGLDDPADVAVLYVTDRAHLAPVVAGVPPITDDRPRLEFTAPAAYFHQEGLGRAALAWVAARLDPSPAPGGASFALRAALLEAQLALLAGDRPTELRAYLDALALGPHVPTVRAALRAIADERSAAGDARTSARVAEALDAAVARMHVDE